MSWASRSNRALHILSRFVHPHSFWYLYLSFLLQSFPVIVALETSPTPSISNRASALHAILQGKHSSLLNTRYTISARKSFDYQKKFATGTVQGLSSTCINQSQYWYYHYRVSYATHTNRSSTAMVFSYPRETANKAGLPEVARENIPRKPFIRIDPGWCKLYSIYGREFRCVWLQDAGGGSHCRQISYKRPFNDGNAIAGNRFAVPPVDTSPCAFAIAATTIPTAIPTTIRTNPYCRHPGAAEGMSTIFELQSYS